VALAVWLLLLGPFVLALGAQMLLRSVFRRYRAMPNHAGVTGAEAVRVEQVPGALTDHYDGTAKALRLSEAVGRERSVASLGIAAHEVSHAYQDAEGSRVYRARQSIGMRLAQVGPWGSIFLVGGFWFGAPLLVALSLIFVGGLVLFALVTLPVEVGASHRGLQLLQQTGLADDGETREIKRVLWAAALTYVVGLLDRLGFFLALLFIAEAARRAMT
jgi:uncharacterized protein